MKVTRFYVKKSTDFFKNVFISVQNERRKSGQRSDDFIDFLNDVTLKTETEEFKKLGITSTTLLAQAVEFYTAGQDAMAGNISILAFYLTQNPDIERKLYAEIDGCLKKNNGKISHETFGQLPFLTACLNECLRLHPIFNRIERVCNRDWEWNGYKIKKGMVVTLPLWSYNRNPKYFENP